MVFLRTTEKYEHRVFWHHHHH